MAIRQSKLLGAAGLAVLILWSSGTWAAEKENVCKNRKLEAAANYFQCLIGVYRRANIRSTEPSEDSIAQCDARFQQTVEQAEAGGACHTPGNASVLGDLIKADARAAALGITAELGDCTALNITSQFATCTLGVGSRAVDLAAVLTAINNVGANVDNNTPFYIEAWGGDGGAGNTNNGSRGGYGGYAQTTTTTSAVSATYGTTELYYFLGYNGSGAANAGGDGGTATMITTNDLAMSVVVTVMTKAKRMVMSWVPWAAMVARRSPPRALRGWVQGRRVAREKVITTAAAAAWGMRRERAEGSTAPIMS